MSAFKTRRFRPLCVVLVSTAAANLIANARPLIGYVIPVELLMLILNTVGLFLQQCHLSISDAGHSSPITYFCPYLRCFAV
jgi:hypothetical protein